MTGRVHVPSIRPFLIASAGCKLPALLGPVWAALFLSFHMPPAGREFMGKDAPRAERWGHLQLEAESLQNIALSALPPCQLPTGSQSWDVGKRL